MVSHVCISCSCDDGSTHCATHQIHKKPRMCCSKRAPTVNPRQVNAPHCPRPVSKFPRDPTVLKNTPISVTILHHRVTLASDWRGALVGDGSWQSRLDLLKCCQCHCATLEGAWCSHKGTSLRYKFEVKFEVQVHQGGGEERGQRLDGGATSG